MSKIKELDKNLEVKNEQLFVLHDVLDEDITYSIFKILEKNNVFQIVAGDTILSSKKFLNYADAERYINKKPWEIIVNLSLWFIENFQDFQEKYKDLELNKEDVLLTDKN